MTALRRQEEVSPEAVQALISTATQSTDETLQDYAAQHLGHLHEQGVLEDNSEIEATLWASTKTTEGTVAGVAIEALHKAQEEGRLINAYAIEDQAWSILNNDYTEVVQISALNVLENTNDQELLKIKVHQLLANEDISYSLNLKLNTILAELR